MTTYGAQITAERGQNQAKLGLKMTNRRLAVLLIREMSDVTPALELQCTGQPKSLIFSEHKRSEVLKKLPLV